MTTRLTVVGDVLLDRDITGSVDRVCPDAPAPVLNASGETARPGGAGLAAALLAADGHDVTLVAPVGDDPAGSRLRALLAFHGVHLVAPPTEGTTREKVRVRAGGQSLIRLDFGTPCRPAADLPGAAMAALREADAVLVSDYAGGVTAHEPTRRELRAAARDGIVVWDPHVRGATPVPGARLVTPNEDEAALLSGRVPAGLARLAAAGRRADLLVQRWRVHAVCLTLGRDGALLSYGSGAPLLVPARARDVRDTCGAGDRFAGSATAALAGGAVVSDAVQAAVRSAAAFVAAGGATGFGRRATAPPRGTAGVPDRSTGWDRVDRVRAAGGTVVAAGGCFDLLHAGHVALLRAARDLGDCLVVCLNSDASVRRLKGDDRPLVPQADRARVLEALACVDAVVIFDEDTPEAVLERIRPHVWAKGGDYALADLPEAATLRRWGGSTVVLPYLDGRSTTRLIGAARTLTAKESR